MHIPLQNFIQEIGKERGICKAVGPFDYRTEIVWAEQGLELSNYKWFSPLKEIKINILRRKNLLKIHQSKFLTLINFFFFFSLFIIRICHFLNITVSYSIMNITMKINIFNVVKILAIQGKILDKKIFFYFHK